MPKNRDNDKDNEELDDEEFDDEELDDEELDDEELDDEDDEEFDDEELDDEDLDEAEAEAEAKAAAEAEARAEAKAKKEAQRRKARRKRAAERRKRAEREAKKESDDDDPEEEKPRRQRKTSSRRRSTEGRSSTSSRRRRRETSDEPRRSSRKRGAVAPAKRKRAKDTEVLEVIEPNNPPDHEVDLGGDLEPTWEPGITVGGAAGLVGVAFAVTSLMTSASEVSAISIFGLVILLLAIAAGCIGVLARKSWGYILGIGSTGLGSVGGLLWTLYSVVGSNQSAWWPLGFLVCNVVATLALFQMRWGPGPFADERDRLRSLKLKTAKHTTVSGELALSGSVAAVLASVLCGLMLMGADSGSHGGTSAEARFTDGMELQPFTEAPETGSLVLARWGNEDYYFLGRVEQSRNGDEFSVSYLDGDRAWVNLRDLRQDGIQTDASVHVHVQGHDGWLPAVVTQRSGNRVEADVGNNQRVWVQLGMVRVREAP